jgi:hypothetical protein
VLPPDTRRSRSHGKWLSAVPHLFQWAQSLCGVGSQGRRNSLRTLRLGFVFPSSSASGRHVPQCSDIFADPLNRTHIERGRYCFTVWNARRQRICAHLVIGKQAPGYSPPNATISISPVLSPIRPHVPNAKRPHSGQPATVQRPLWYSRLS